jgi:AraC-like DNA-binding protein/mannose-6-phosphate isomerase-like protein (cupin superfamily)
MKLARSNSPVVINLAPAGRLLSGQRYLYRKNDKAGLIEIGTWSGDRCLPLTCHFHSEIQLTFVLSGRYRFVVGDQMVSAKAGEWVFIPALRPHAPVPHKQPGTTIFNVYVPVEQWPLDVTNVVVLPMRDTWLSKGSLHLDDLVDLLRQARPLIEVSYEPVDQFTLELLDSRDKIYDIASTIGLSRQGFIRKFTRQVGMSPHAYRLMRNLNDARALLRRGEAITMVADETGFADRSELGRRFRRAFGTTPGLYRKLYV